jgi:hypothetical protein
MQNRNTLGFVVAMALLSGASAQAQTGASARDVLSFLVTNQAVQTADVVKDRQAAEATRDTVARALLIELATLPITTSSGGFTYRFDPEIGTVARVTEGFGPFFVDRATTSGRGQASMSMAFRYSTYSSLDGRDLADGTFVTTANKFRDEPTPFDVDALTMSISTRTVTVFGNYGVTDWCDLGVAVPIVRLKLSGERMNKYRGTTFVQARGSSDSAGVADIAVRGKLQLIRASASQIAADIELRLPTGSVEDLRGAGRTALRTSVIASVGRGPIEGHVNGAVTVGGISKEADLAGAVAMAASDRLTVSAEATLRRIDALTGIQAVAQPSSLIAGMDTTRLLPTLGGTTTAAAIAGVRWNVASTWLLNGYVVVPLTNHGLTPRPIPALALEYSFVR